MEPLQFESVDDQMAEVLRQRTGPERLAIARGLWRTARRIVEASERRRHPELSDEALARRVAERMGHGG